MKIPQPEGIVLTPEEQALFDRIAFDPDRYPSEEADRESSTAAAVELMRSLRSRKVIPRIRLRYFTDPDLNVGGHGKSRKEVFEGKGVRGDAMLRHPHFLEYLKYFICGPDLLPETIDKFRQVLVEDAGTSGMILDQLQRVARAEARRLAPERQTHLHEEFFKLALECEVNEHVARCVRDAVRQVR